jgi:hypothetical protein
MYDVQTVQSGREYRVQYHGTPLVLMLLPYSDDPRGDTCTQGHGFVQLYSATTNYGAYRIERFDGALNPAGIRKFLAWLDTQSEGKN